MTSIPGDDPDWLLPFEGMDVGNSFFIPTLKPAQMVDVIQERAKAARVKVRVYTASTDGFMGVRVWRVS